MVQRKQKKETGVTLIALVITIIILLILAGITINALTGDNGLFGRAKEAKEQTRLGQIDDYVKMWKLDIFTRADDPALDISLSREQIVDDLILKGLINSSDRAKCLAGPDYEYYKQDMWDINFNINIGETNQYADIEIGDYITGYTPVSRDFNSISNRKWSKHNTTDICNRSHNVESAGYNRGYNNNSK